jgi:DNA methylase
MSEAAAGNDTISLSPKLRFGHSPVDARPAKSKRSAHPLQTGLFATNAAKRPRTRKPSLSAEDNTPEGLRALLDANRYYREVPWPSPHNRTTHRLHLGDARDLSWIADQSVHLVVTSPPYWTLKEYEAGNENQLGHFEDYELFLGELDRVWAECARVLVGGGRICCVVGDVCIPRKQG